MVVSDGYFSPIELLERLKGFSNKAVITLFASSLAMQLGSIRAMVSAVRQREGEVVQSAGVSSESMKSK